MQLMYSFIVPVYNRPKEIDELLESLTKLKTNLIFEVVIVEDGSSITSENIVDNYRDRLNISYYFKRNSGPGDSRNFGMNKAKGNYFIILDSDCILPKQYLDEVDKALTSNYLDCFGGPDTSHSSFSNIQKAINFAMTSLITTGGIRGKKHSASNFEPRSFNMGISKEAFEASNGFGSIHPGEDPDLSIRLSKLGFKTGLVPNAFVYHKRRISWSKFYKQVNKFGLVRPILNLWHPSTRKFTYWFPSLFCLGLLLAIICFAYGFNGFLYLYILYFLVAFVSALFSTKNLFVSVLALFAILIQFFGYGMGFLKSTIVINIMHKDPQSFFPELFFKKE